MYIFIFFVCILSIPTSFSYSVSLCSHGYFSSDGGECQPWLNCSVIQGLEVGDLVGFGAVKKVYKSTWNGIDIALVFPNNAHYINDFYHGLEILIQLSQSAFISDLIGHCKESDVYVLKYYPYGALSHFEEFLPLDPNLNIKKRFKLCLNYIKIINFIHTSQSTPAVMCDTNTLNKTLEQYLLVETDTMVLNDVDSLTLVKSDGIVCGHQEITGDFVAPEQRWPYRGRTYDKRLMPHYNEKTDIWKIPSVCQHILGNSNSALTIKFRLFKINKQCRSLDPSLRPTALKVLLSYDEVYTEFFGVKDEL